MAEIRMDPPVIKYFKKLKDQKLKSLFMEAIRKISEDYTIGDIKTGELKGIYCYDLRYSKTDYRIAYQVQIVDGEIIIILKAGPHENFYRDLKKYLG